MKSASTFPTLLERFFMDRLMRQRQVSPRNTPLRKETIAVLRSWL
ncbi:MAG: integrase, partial [Mesorhizobium sp.]